MRIVGRGRFQTCPGPGHLAQVGDPRAYSGGYTGKFDDP